MRPKTQEGSVFQPEPAALPIPGALLVFCVSTPQLRSVALPANGTMTFSRDDVGGVALPDPRVSQPHCELSFDGRQFTVKDLSSKNGTWLNGEKVEPGQSRSGPTGSVLRTAQSLFLLFDNLRKFQGGSVSTGEQVIGPTYRAALEQVALGARGGTPVLVMGENGSGKELAARTFHEAANKAGPFVTINCGGLTKTLIESALFGQVKNAFNEAKETRGLIREASGGTFFLDELGELDLHSQARFLRVVEQQEVMPVGSSTAVKVDVKLISATNKDLKAAVEAKEFREDLYYRLAQFQVEIPPLRARREEIPWLIAHVLGDQPAHPSLVEQAMLRPWPGNVRELIAQVKQAGSQAREAGSAAVRDLHLFEGAGKLLFKARVPDETIPARPSAMAKPQRTKEQVLAALEANGWNYAATARAMGIPNRTTLVREITRFGLVRPTNLPPDADNVEE